MCAGGMDGWVGLNKSLNFKQVWISDIYWTVFLICLGLAATSFATNQTKPEIVRRSHH